MRSFSFHLMPYPALPPDCDGPAWVDVPSRLFDTEVGSAVCNRHLDELILAEPRRRMELFASEVMPRLQEEFA